MEFLNSIGVSSEKGEACGSQKLEIEDKLSKFMKLSKAPSQSFRQQVEAVEKSETNQLSGQRYRQLRQLQQSGHIRAYPS